MKTNNEIQGTTKTFAKYICILNSYLFLQFGVAVVICNQVLSNVSGSNAMFGEQLLAAGGHVLSHFAKTRLVTMHILLETRDKSLKFKNYNV